MRVFVTGGSGEIGRPAVAALVAAGHDVTGTARHASAPILERLGARPIAVDLLDAEALIAAAIGADAIIHLATAIPPSAAMGDLTAWELNDRLRAETTRHLAAAADATGSRLILQSYFGVAAPQGEAWIDEGPDRISQWSGIGVMDSMRAAEQVALGVDAVVLRFGSLYSPSSEQLHAQIRSLEDGSAAIPGDGANFWPFVASEDAGRAVARAVSIAPGIYDVADGRPVTLADFWTMAAGAIGVDVPTSTSVDGHPMAPILLGSWRPSTRVFRDVSGWEPEVADSVLEGWPIAAERARSDGVGLRPAT